MKEGIIKSGPYRSFQCFLFTEIFLSTTGESPARLLLGKGKSTRLDNLVPSPRQSRAEPERSSKNAFPNSSLRLHGGDSVLALDNRVKRWPCGTIR
ncbi:hypothetical protein PoB_001500500 [Plakobranchus ocellatus]|uniref:Uncharacterized protein n=1 Tax=Plakobranchus ocellatus TaxID=259542 RepID=A0AAV3YZX0_9GAST|nr:hypothetical protein PoB_001500500 [Plakobranchus ocellatus]